ncbi:MAG TPA: MEDS domain-containing protein [Anaerolineae bacterium]|nr:MEDS domain-containing protein [Anaerolineae bacterium]
MPKPGYGSPATVTNHSPRAIADLGPGDHLCCIYETEEEHRSVVTSFLRQGLEQGEKVIYIVDTHTAATILGYLRDEGLDVESHLARGQLAVLTRDEAYMREGVFDPEGMIALLRDETEQALAEGYPALRVTGEMTWALRGLPGSKRLIEYEARLNEFFPGSQCLAICQYDRRRFDPAVLLEVLHTHPIAIIGTEVYDNFYYIPPVELLSDDPAAAELRYCVHNLAERKRAEEALQQYAERIGTLREIDQAVLGTYSVEEIAEAALHHVRQLVPYQRASIAVFDFEAGVMSLLAASSDGESRLGKGWRGSLEQAWFVKELDQAHVVEDLLALPPSSSLIRALQAEGVRSYVNLPIIAQGELIGSLNLGMDRPGKLDPEHVDIALEVADQLAIGIQQARLYEEVRRHADELERRVAVRTAELRTSQARLRAIFNGTAIGIALVDMEGRLVESNPALQEILGYSGEELCGMVFTDFTHPDDAMTVGNLHRELVAGKRDRYKTENRYIRKDGRKVWANLTVSLVRGASDEPQFAIGMVEDITEQKQIQAALLQAEKLAIAGKLAASLAHEINNPLQSVIGCLGLAKETLAEGGDVSQYLRVAHEELRRVARIVAQLRDLNRPPRPEKKEPTDVNGLLEGVLVLSRKQCENRQVEIIWKAAADLPLLLLARDQVQQVFLNLLLNALDAMPGGGRFQVSTTRTSQPAGVRIAFTDSGVGIPPDVLPHVFDLFYSTKPEGLGLGLPISHDIVKQHGGRIEINSQVGEGTTVTVWLPA